MDLWGAKKTGSHGIGGGTQNIGEAAMLADRIIVFNSTPGSIRGGLRVTLPRPRSDLDPRFRN